MKNFTLIYTLAATALLIATRSHMIPHVYDLTWTIMFLVGYHLGGYLRYVVPVLLAAAVGTDVVVIGQAGVPFWDHYCVSPAYLATPVAYALVAGLAYATAAHRLARGMVPLMGAVVTAHTLCYTITNGAFYWLGDSFTAERTMGGWVRNYLDWWPTFVGVQTAATAIVFLTVAIAASWTSRHSDAPR